MKNDNEIRVSERRNYDNRRRKKINKNNEIKRMHDDILFEKDTQND